MERKDRRKDKPPIPDGLEDLLSMDQRATLRQLENYGWELKFVRRPLFQDPVLVVFNTIDGRHSLLEADGSLLPMEDFKLRGDPDSV